MAFLCSSNSSVLLSWSFVQFSISRGSGEHVQHAPDAFVPTLHVTEVLAEHDQGQGNLQRPQLGASGQHLGVGIVVFCDGFFIHHRGKIPLWRSKAHVLEIYPHHFAPACGDQVLPLFGVPDALLRRSRIWPAGASTLSGCLRSSLILRLAIGLASGFARYSLQSPLPLSRARPPRGNSGRTPAGNTPREPLRPRLRNQRSHAPAPDASLPPGRRSVSRLSSGVLLLSCGVPPGGGPREPAPRRSKRPWARSPHSRRAHCLPPPVAFLSPCPARPAPAAPQRERRTKGSVQRARRGRDPPCSRSACRGFPQSSRQRERSPWWWFSQALSLALPSRQPPQSSRAYPTTSSFRLTVSECPLIISLCR